MHPDELRIGFRDHTLKIQQGNVFVHFDRTGRFLFSVEPQRVVRRGLDHRMLEICQQVEDGRMIRKYRDLTESEKKNFLAQIYSFARTAFSESITLATNQWLEKILHWEQADLSLDALTFRKCYHPVSILPPDQYKALVVQITEGCSYNRCLFCDFYRDRHFHIKTIPELLEHLYFLKDFFGDRLQDRQGIFLGDGNALVIPTKHLLQMLSLIRQEIGTAADHFSTFMDTFNIHKKTLDDLHTIHEYGVKTVYVGFETGADELRAILMKPGTVNQAVMAIQQLKTAGMRLGIIILAGAGGATLATKHINETLRAIEQMSLTKDDIIFLSPFVTPNNLDYKDKAKEKNLLSLTEEEIEDQVRTFKQKLKLVTQAKVTKYLIEEHLY